MEIYAPCMLVVLSFCTIYYAWNRRRFTMAPSLSLMHIMFVVHLGVHVVDIDMYLLDGVLLYCFPLCY